jgi:hypothetical protein
MLPTRGRKTQLLRSSLFNLFYWVIIVICYLTRTFQCQPHSTGLQTDNPVLNKRSCGMIAFLYQLTDTIKNTPHDQFFFFFVSGLEEVLAKVKAKHIIKVPLQLLTTSYRCQPHL